jgi:hypothetical protein
MQFGTVMEDESSIAIGRSFGAADRDRYAYDRADVLEDALDCWRLNPLGRRIVELTTQYVVGGGISLLCKHEPTARFLREFWKHRLNRMDVRVFELCDELSRSGNLFILVSTDAAGMSYLRCIPAQDVDHIQSLPNDIEQPTRFYMKQVIGDGEGEPCYPEYYPAYNDQQDRRSPDGAFSAVMLHYTINRPVGGQWGESDLAPVLKWISRYSAWLEDRARLNRFRNAFLFVVKATFASETERAARQAALAANPPQPGSIMVADTNESWEVLSPRLESHEASADGAALKKMIAAGTGLPMHFLAEPESSTRTTAEAAGGPTYRHFEQRQEYFLWILQDMLQVVTARRCQVDKKLKRKPEIEVRGADISARDNVGLGMAGSNIIHVLEILRNRNLIDNEELLRMVYRFVGEYVDVTEMLRRAQAEGAQPIPGVDAPARSAPSPGEPHPPGKPGRIDRPNTPTTPFNPAGNARDIDTDTGEPKEKLEM